MSKSRLRRHRFTCVNVDDLVPDFIQQDIVDHLSDTGKVSFGDAKATLVTPEQFAEVVDELSGVITFNITTFKKVYGNNTLINFGS